MRTDRTWAVDRDQTNGVGDRQYRRSGDVNFRVWFWDRRCCWWLRGHPFGRFLRFGSIDNRRRQFVRWFEVLRGCWLRHPDFRCSAMSRDENAAPNRLITAGNHNSQEDWVTSEGTWAPLLAYVKDRLKCWTLFQPDIWVSFQNVHATRRRLKWTTLKIWRWAQGECEVVAAWRQTGHRTRQSRDSDLEFARIGRFPEVVT